MVLSEIERWCKIKGIDIVGSGDLTHPGWFKELKNNLESDGSGLYTLRGSDKKTKFILTTEISCIYSKKGKTRRLHIIYFVPSLETAEKINKKLDSVGNIKSDGRPILGLDVKDVAKIFWDIDPDCLVIPAHAWTPWFSIFGSFSGFDSIKECYEELSPRIFGIETGLSSDPEMNWRWSELDNITLISNSDAHSPSNLGREANVLEIDSQNLSYAGLVKILKKNDKEKFLYTIEFFPQEGKYHYDGHSRCGVVFSPRESFKNKNLCPKCRKPLTIGVSNRVCRLADRKKIDGKGRVAYRSVIPLQEIIAEVLGKQKNTKTVDNFYFDLIKKGGSEFKILLDLSAAELKKITLPQIATAVEKMKKGEVFVQPGYDGVYGKVSVFNPKEMEKLFPKQEALL